MSAGGKAVFLSYASQDAAAAERICAALRAAGVEVWFDRDELVGGDAWDAKIRRQIKECALFMPLISANTDARAEGYFRLEWKLAVDRSYLMADDVPFLLPLVLGDTAETTARVPDRFREVQWTRVRLEETPAELARRVAGLLSGAGPAAVARAAVAATGAATGNAEQPKAAATSKAAWIGYAWAGVGIVFALVYAVRPMWQAREKRSREPAAAVNASAPTAPAAPAAKTASAVWPRDPELRRAVALIDSLESTREDFLLAEDIVMRVAEKAPSDAEAVTVAARVQNGFLLRNFDFRAERTTLAKRYGERAVQLAPEHPDALLALAIFLTSRGGDPARAETLSRRAIAVAPDRPDLGRSLVRALEAQPGRQAEALAEMEKWGARFPDDALTRYELSLLYRVRGRPADFERELDAVLAITPLPNALNWKARAALGRGDLAEMRRWLDRVPARARAEERTVTSAFVYATLGGDAAYGLAALQTFAEPWFYDANYYSGPAALPRAELLARQGRPGQARVQYEAALAEINRRKAENPGDTTGRLAEIWTLHGLGRKDEALALHRVAMESRWRPHRVPTMVSWTFDAIPRALLVGDRAGALELMREAAAVPEDLRTLRLRMQWDARMAGYREDPEIAAVLGAGVE
jgi:tetratricopeptide (TPR) repeat protein